MTVDDLLLDVIDLEYHPTVMAAAGTYLQVNEDWAMTDVSAVRAAEAAYAAGGYVLVVEGAIPMAEDGGYCYVWEGMTMLDALQRYSEHAARVLAVGTCAAYGGIPAGKPNPTNALGVQSVLGETVEDKLINIPGCPAHPDWIVGTVAYLLTHGFAVPPLDWYGRPLDYFGERLCKNCPNAKHGKPHHPYAYRLSEEGCLEKLGCNGPETEADCPIRKWNSPDADLYGVNWCVGARNPCQGCTDPKFPDTVSPFYTLEDTGMGM